MKKFLTIFMVIVFTALALVATPLYAQDNVVDKMGDWMATRGKNETEKTMILTERRAQRAAKRAEQAMKQQSKKMEKDMNKMFK